jgi:hypothetical protein
MHTKLTEAEMLARLVPGSVLLAPLIIHHCELLPAKPAGVADAYLRLGLPDSDESFGVVLESKTRSTPQDIQLGLSQARAAARNGEHPMVQVPFLSTERLNELERAKASGVDLCGNGVVIIPGRLWIVRSGHPNEYRDSRPLNNPYRGRSALVARALLSHASGLTLGSLVQKITEQGAELSLSQASKAIQAMEQDLIVQRLGPTIYLPERQQLLDKLGREWKPLSLLEKQSVRLPHGPDSLARLNTMPSLKWIITGESTASRHVTFVQGGPRRVAVTNLAQAISALEAIPESVPNFADVELLEVEEPGVYYGSVTDDRGIHWASRLETWLELQAGDARQREAAQDLRRQILNEART